MVTVTSKGIVLYGFIAKNGTDTQSLHQVVELGNYSENLRHEVQSFSNAHEPLSHHISFRYSYDLSLPLDCLGISFSREEKVQSVAMLINGSGQPPASTFDVHVNFIDPPRVTRGTQMSPAALVQLRTVSLDPSIDGAMVYSQTAFLGPLFYLSVAEASPGALSQTGVAAVPPHTAQNDCREVMTPFEQARLGHKAGS